MKKIDRNSIPVSDSNLCEYGEIGQATELQIRYGEANRQTGITLDEWLKTDDDAHHLVSRAWNAVTPERQLEIVLGMFGVAVRGVDVLAKCIREITCGS